MHLACVLMHMSMPEALIGGTLNAAAALGLSETHGSIEEGKFGDMIVINADRFVLLTVTSNLNISKTFWFEIAKEISNTCTIVFFVWKRKYYQNRCGSVLVGSCWFVSFLCSVLYIIVCLLSFFFVLSVFLLITLLVSSFFCL